MAVRVGTIVSWEYQNALSLGRKIVYAGNGIAGYERLVIVKHSGNLLSAYGLMDEFLVSEQQRVRTGQSLAELKPRNGNSQGAL